MLLIFLPYTDMRISNHDLLNHDLANWRRDYVYWQRASGTPESILVMRRALMRS